MLTIVYLTLIAPLLRATNAILTSGPEEIQAIGECLISYGGLTPENEQRLQRYKQWSDNYEEIPCFTNCYLNKMFDFYNETTGFNEERVIKNFGRSLYEECKYRLKSYGRNHCELAYNGLHCLASLENDPFIMIERMEKLDAEAKTAMKDCLRKFDEYEWPRLHEYAKFPVREPIACYTKCFLENLQLFDSHLGRWNIQNMRYKLGVPLHTANINSCLAMGRRRNRNSCAWMYQEFTCFALAQ